MIHTAFLNEDMEVEWTNFVLNHPKGLIYYTLNYRNFLLDITRAHSRYRVALDDQKIVGVLPIMEADGPYGKVLNALPFYGSYGSPLTTSLAAETALLRDWSNMISGNNFASATIIVNPLQAVKGVIPFRVDAVDKRSGQFTTLASGPNAEELIISSVDGAARRNIKQAHSLGIIVKENPSALDFLEKVHRENMKDIGGSAKPPRYFDAIDSYFEYGIDWRLYVAYSENIPVAAVLMFYSNGVAEYFTPAITAQGRIKQATSLILLKAMVDASERGFRNWNWGGTWSDQDGVFRFKRKWGAETYEYHYLTTIGNDKIREASKAEILDLYPYFYVIPFHLLGG